METGDAVWILFSDWPFWIILGMSSVIGLWSWMAAVLSFVIVISGYVLWDRSRSQYLCRDCGNTWGYSDVLEGGTRSHLTDRSKPDGAQAPRG
jgi:hypothetical protein